MNMNHKELEYFFFLHANSHMRMNRKGCPSIQKMIQLRKRKILRFKLGKISEHIQNCSLCSKEMKFILNLELETASFVKDIRNLFQERSNYPLILSGKSIRYIKPLLGFSLLIVCFLMFFTTEFVNNPMRAPFNAHSFEKWKIVEPYGKIDKSSLSCFRWEYYGQAKYFSVQLFDEALIPQWQSIPSISNSVIIPMDILSKLRYGFPYFWIVYAYDKENRIIESNIIEFELYRSNENILKIRTPQIE